MASAKLVLVKWIDSHMGRGWSMMDDIEESATPLQCRSVGWLMFSDNKCCVLVPHIGGELNGNIMLQGSGDITIPHEAIVSTQLLRDKDGDTIQSPPKKSRKRNDG